MKRFSRSVSIMMAVMMLLSLCSLHSFASAEVKVSLRIEGIDKCLFYGDVSVDADSTALDVIKAADEADEALTATIIDSDYGPYLDAINGISAGSYTVLMWDGWSYMVDGTAPEVGISAYKVENGDVIVVYYGDPWNTGMQYPVMDTTKLSDGIISFTSTDTVYDENWNAVEKEVAVTDYVLTWGYNGKTVEIIPDEDGVCKIPYKYLTIGEHTVQIEKYDAETGLPTVLRFAPDFSVSVSILDGIIAFFRMIIETITAFFA